MGGWAQRGGRVMQPQLSVMWLLCAGTRLCTLAFTVCTHVSCWRMTVVGQVPGCQDNVNSHCSNVDHRSLFWRCTVSVMLGCSYVLSMLRIVGTVTGTC